MLNTTICIDPREKSFLHCGINQVVLCKICGQTLCEKKVISFPNTTSAVSGIIRKFVGSFGSPFLCESFTTDSPQDGGWAPEMSTLLNRVAKM